MKTETAIHMIESDKRLHHDYLSDNYRKALNLAIKALEKQIPKEPITRWNGDEILYSSEELICSECKNSICFLEEDIDLVKKYSTYCGVCGQKIDWEV